jgi:putative membrane protein
MGNFGFAILKNMIILKIVTLVIPGIGAHGFHVFLSAAFVLWGLNLLLKPLLILITLPINLVSLGIFTFFINGFLFYLIPKFVNGFRVESFFQAVLGAIVFSITDLCIGFLFKSGNFKVHYHSGQKQPSAPASSGYKNVIDAEVVQPKDTKELGKSTSKNQQ